MAAITPNTRLTAPFRSLQPQQERDTPLTAVDPSPPRAAPLLVTADDQVLPRGTSLPAKSPAPLPPLQPRGDRIGIFLTSDDQLLTRNVEETHIPDGGQLIDVRPLFLLVEDIIARATQTVQGATPGAEITKETRATEGKDSLTALASIPDLSLIIERIFCEMTCKSLAGGNAHDATLSVLKLLGHFPWEAKVVLTLAAFSFTYGEFWLLAQIYSTNPLANSMARLKQLRLVTDQSGSFKYQFDAVNKLIKAILNVTRCIVEFTELPSTYITEEESTLKATRNYFPIAVYWTIRSIVGAAAQITTLTSSGQAYLPSITEAWELSNWENKLNTIYEHFLVITRRLSDIIARKREDEAYDLLYKFIYERIHIDNFPVLNRLFGLKDDPTPLYHCSSKRRVQIDALRGKNVLLLISDLNISQEELSMLEQIYNYTKIHQYEVVWLPIIDRSIQWNNVVQARFEKLWEPMQWYSVYQPAKVDTAVISAFPFTSKKEADLWLDESWKLELLVDAIDQTILDWIREEKYIFIHGGDDIDWIRKFSKQAREVAQSANIKLEIVYVGKSHIKKDALTKVTDAVRSESLSYFWQDPTTVWFFWQRIQSMFLSKIQLEQADNISDTITQEIKKLLSYDRSPGGWAMLTKGSAIVLHGHGSTIYTALLQYEREWKKEAATAGFVNAFLAHLGIYDIREVPCSQFHFPASVGRVPPGMRCPVCGLPMEKNTTFICCHEEALGAAELAAALPPAV
ncbi:hypothetical protein Nepgr_025754 [Nepenthes gracilis]|uniref:Protein SIEVE ELEMENT OCCLUSION B-like n=1 Tax=Nepenthes gracilis TaxID=150966 RepID=A0AAD3Y1U7_NEPGR|nr:hypothetical protein Nepgr_025754 [Nepenthes gracilis]